MNVVSYSSMQLSLSTDRSVSWKGEENKLVELGVEIIGEGKM